MTTNQSFKTNIPGLILRFARKRDVPLILAFIRELAEYEQLSKQVVADETILQKSLFGERRVAEVILAQFENKPVGFSLFFHNFSTFLGKPGLYIEDLFVRSEHRGQGIGRTILSFLAKLAIERDCGRIEWWVLDWNKSAIDFYQKIGARAMNDWTVFRLTGDALQHLAKKELIFRR